MQKATPPLPLDRKTVRRLTAIGQAEAIHAGLRAQGQSASEERSDPCARWAPGMICSRRRQGGHHRESSQIIYLMRSHQRRGCLPSGIIDPLMRAVVHDGRLQHFQPALQSGAVRLVGWSLEEDVRREAGADGNTGRNYRR